MQWHYLTKSQFGPEFCTFSSEKFKLKPSINLPRLNHILKKCKIDVWLKSKERKQVVVGFVVCLMWRLTKIAQPKHSRFLSWLGLLCVQRYFKKKSDVKCWKEHFSNKHFQLWRYSKTLADFPAFNSSLENDKKHYQRILATQNCDVHYLYICKSPLVHRRWLVVWDFTVTALCPPEGQRNVHTPLCLKSTSLSSAVLTIASRPELNGSCKTSPESKHLV